MNVSLTPELERLINEKVDSGLYQTASRCCRWRFGSSAIWRNRW